VVQREPAFMALFSVGIHIMKPCDMGDFYARLKYFLNNGNFFLWRTAPAALWPEKLFHHAYLPT